ncbi:MAG: M23 family metallopeptidase [Ilumatobacteraceae bacterium]
MAAPNLTISLQPMEGAKAVYLELAAPQAGQGGHAMVILRLRIKNAGSTAVVVSGIRFSFPGSSVPPVDMEGVAYALDPDGDDVGPLDALGRIEAGQSATWSNGRVDVDPSEKGEDMRDNMVYLAGPVPPQVLVEVFCEGFSQPATVGKELAKWAIPEPTGSLRFPIAAGDLRDGEFVVGRSWHWANGGASGTQIMSHDVSVQAVTLGAWSELLPGRSGTNDSYRIWNVPIRAMADGTVESFESEMDDNATLGEQKPTPDPVTGNHFWINHGEVRAVYSHLRKGSQPAELLAKGATVKAGQIVGRAGNTGNSTNPHTHLELRRSGTSALRGLAFRNASVIDHTAFVPPGPNDPWVTLSGEGLPKSSAAIWPASTTPGFPVPAAGIAMGGSWANSFWISTSRSAFEARAQQLFDDHGRRLVWVSTYVENGARRWAGIARSGNWANAFWTSNNRAAFEAKAQTLYDQQGKRLVHVHTYLDGAARRWIGIARQGDWGSSFWISDDRAAFVQKAQQLFDERGRRLTFVHTFTEGSSRRWIGLARSGTWANAFWISEGLAPFRQKVQQLFDDEGKRLVHVHTYVSAGKRYWVGISRSDESSNSFWYSSDLDLFTQAAQDLYEDKGRRLIAVEFIDP